ncbi:outer membrane protein assembly factor BamE [uncultured Anaerobiospirillum sp.]|uniref:outer membrane protein assembly factor BamE n=1 Tax=uncultured Anaerobiospirillum sp. TaxID=265728 RepID=UPI0028047731|nr:outer membrane protein assembly factor BamE [uncultured Anaerobiospirillum sp.]
MNHNFKKTGAIAASFVALSLITTGCMTNTHAVKEEKITVAKAQTEIKKGMSSAEVVEVLGSPNMVSTDTQGREVWVYDKISTNYNSSSASGSLLGLLFGGSGGGLGGASASTASASTSQRTLTIVVKFDDDSKVRDVSYRASSF